MEKIVKVDDKFSNIAFLNFSHFHHQNRSIRRFRRLLTTTNNSTRFSKLQNREIYIHRNLQEWAESGSAGSQFVYMEMKMSCERMWWENFFFHFFLCRKFIFIWVFTIFYWFSSNFFIINCCCLFFFAIPLHFNDFSAEFQLSLSKIY